MTYSIDTHTSRLEFQGTAAEAVRRASLVCYLAPRHFAQHAERLVVSGRTVWTHGFSTVVVQVEAI